MSLLDIPKARIKAESARIPDAGRKRYGPELKLTDTKTMKKFVMLRAEQLDMSLKNLADKLGVTPQTLDWYINQDDPRPLKVTTTRKLADFACALELTIPSVVTHMCKLAGYERHSRNVLDIVFADEMKRDLAK